MGNIGGAANLLLVLIVVYYVRLTFGSTCPANGAIVGPSVTQYTVIDGANHGSNAQAAVLLDPIDVPACCGVVSEFTLMVNGDSVYYGCEAAWGGCYIDLIVWKNLDPTLLVDGYGATIKGIVNNVYVETDSNWPNSPSPYTITLTDNQKIPVDTSTPYYIGWNSYYWMAVDYITNSSNGCAQPYVSCIEANEIWTTELLLPGGYPSSNLTAGNAYRNFRTPSKARFYAFQAIVTSGATPSFVREGITLNMLASVGAGVNVANAAAINPETQEILTYSITSETPTGISCFDVNSVDGMITTSQAMTSCVGSHSVTVSVSDGCNTASTTYTFVVWPTITAGTNCPSGGSIAGPSLTPIYTVHDNSSHISQSHAGILLDPIDVPDCCGVVTAFIVMVNGDSTYLGCEHVNLGCTIDLIIWKNVDMTYLSNGYGATIHGIVNNVYVETDPKWPANPQPTTITLTDIQKIPINTNSSYYIGWNCQYYMAVDFITDDNNGCAQEDVSCVAANKILTTEHFMPGVSYSSSTLTAGSAYRNFDNPSTPRFYAFQVVVDSGESPSFASPGTTILVNDTTTAGDIIVNATATNPETLETLTYSKTLEIPFDITCFNVDPATGTVTAAQAMMSCDGQHTVTVAVSDGCNSATATYIFDVLKTTTTLPPTKTVATTTIIPTTTIVTTTQLSTTTVNTTAQMPEETEITSTTETPTNTVAFSTDIPATTTETTTQISTTLVPTTMQIPRTTGITTTTDSPTTTVVTTTLIPTSTVATTTQVTTTSVATITKQSTTTQATSTTEPPTTTVATTTIIPTTTAETTTQIPTTAVAVTTQIPTTTQLTTTIEPPTTTVATTTTVETSTTILATTSATTTQPNTTSFATTTAVLSTTINVATTSQNPATTAKPTMNPPTSAIIDSTAEAHRTPSVMSVAQTASTAANAVDNNSQASVEPETTVTTTTSSTTTVTATTVSTTTKAEFINTVDGKALVGVCAGFGLIAVAGVLFGISVALSKRTAGSVNKVAMAAEQLAAQKHDILMRLRSRPRYYEPQPKKPPWRY